MTPAGIGPRLGASLVTSISGSDCGRRKIYSCEFQSALALPSCLHFTSCQLLCSRDHSWSVVAGWAAKDIPSSCSVPTFPDHSTAALGQGQSRAVLPRLGPCQQLRPPRACCVTKYSQIAAGPRGAWTCLTAHCQKCRSASKGLVTMELRSCGTLCGMWQTLECATWN